MPFDQEALSPDARASAPPSPVQGGTSGAGAAHFLFSRARYTRTDSRRVAIGLAALGIVAVFLLNVAILQEARSRLAGDRWQRLGHRTETSRDQITQILGDLEVRLRSLAEDVRFAGAVRTAMEAPLGGPEQAALREEMNRVVRLFGLEQATVYNPEGVPLAVASTREAAEAESPAMVRRVLESRKPFVADIGLDDSGRRVFELSLPLPAAESGGRTPVLQAVAPAEDRLRLLLEDWKNVGPTAFGYLVRTEGETVKFLTPGERSAGDEPPATAPITARDARAAVMAATGLEASIEQADPGRTAFCATTRYLPGLGWGIVGRADRDVLMNGMRGKFLELLAMDAILLLGAALALWQWRRAYLRGLARHELRVTRHHAERVQAIFDTAFDAIVTYDSLGRVKTVNRAAEILFGRPGTDLVGEPLHRFLRWSGAEVAGEDHPLPTPGVVVLANALRPDGERIPTEVSLGQSGEGEGLLFNAILRDIRERVEAEQRIRAFAEGLEAGNRRLEEVNAQLQEVSRLKSEFLANTSHELRTPLNGIMGFLQLVLDGMCETPEERQEFLQQALQCSRHLLGLINDVLDIARIEAGKLTLDIQKIQVADLFNEVRTLTHVQATQKGLQLRFLEPEAGAAIRCDLGKAKQVLINLVGNSLKFTPQGLVSVRAVSRPELGHVMFEVEDTGIGIPAEQQAVIFEKFAQGDGSTTRRFGGTGLGLAISRSLVELMGGVIGVTSEGPGRGTRMYFSLPIWNQQMPETAAEDDEAIDHIEGPAGGSLVLVVEDDPVFRKFLAAVLHQNGHRTLEVSSAEAAWVRIRRFQPALVILDYALSCSEKASIRTGWDLATRMTADAELRHVPILFVTGFEDEVRERLRSTAFARKPEHLMKPIDPSSLVRKVEAMVAAITDRPVRILMAEDDPVVVAFVTKVLPAKRFLIDVASNGEECLHILRTQPNGFDLLLLDLMMPVVSGYDVLRDMALTGTAARLPVLVFTNCPEPRNAEEKRLLEQGLVLDVVAKTTVHDNPSLLSHLIDWHLQSRTDDTGSDERPAEAA